MQNKPIRQLSCKFSHKKVLKMIKMFPKCNVIKYNKDIKRIKREYEGLNVSLTLISFSLIPAW